MVRGWQVDQNLGLPLEIVYPNARITYRQCLFRHLPPFPTYHPEWFRRRNHQSLAFIHVPTGKYPQLWIGESVVCRLQEERERGGRWFRRGSGGRQGVSFPFCFFCGDANEG